MSPDASSSASQVALYPILSQFIPAPVLPQQGHRSKSQTLLGAFLLPRDGGSFLPSHPVPSPAAGAEPAGSAVEGCVCVCLSVCARLLCLRQPVQRRAPCGRPRIPAPRIPSPPGPAPLGTPRQAEHRPAPAGPPRQLAGLITSRGLIASRALKPPRFPSLSPSPRAPAAVGLPALPRPSGRAVPAVPAGRLCASGPRLAVPAGPAPSWLPGMNMHSPPSSSSSCMCVCVCGERGSASSAAPAMSARLRLGPP